jgi:CRP-like cAMP-binding protein
MGDVASIVRTDMSPPQTYPAGVELFEQGVRIADVLYIERGLVKLKRMDLHGRETILDLAFATAWVGTAAVIADIPSPASAITCTPSRIARMPALEFSDRLAHDPAFSTLIHQMNARELCRQVAWIGQLTSVTSEQRVRWMIRQLISVLHLQSSDRGIRLRLPLRHYEFAALVAITPEHLSRLLRDLERAGIIRRDRGCVIVPDLCRLLPDAEWVERGGGLPPLIDKY